MSDKKGTLNIDQMKAKLNTYLICIAAFSLFSQVVMLLFKYRSKDEDNVKTALTDTDLTKEMVK